MSDHCLGRPYCVLNHLHLSALILKLQTVYNLYVTCVYTLQCLSAFGLTLVCSLHLVLSTPLTIISIYCINLYCSLCTYGYSLTVTAEVLRYIFLCMFWQVAVIRNMLHCVCCAFSILALAYSAWLLLLLTEINALEDIRYSNSSMRSKTVIKSKSESKIITEN